MKLIVQYSDGNFYVYTENNKHHKLTQPNREEETKFVDYKILKQECNVSINKHLPENWHMVFTLQNNKSAHIDNFLTQCSFCGNSDDKLVIGPEVSICYDCVSVCVQEKKDNKDLANPEKGNT